MKFLSTVTSVTKILSVVRSVAKPVSVLMLMLVSSVVFGQAADDFDLARDVGGQVGSGISLFLTIIKVGTILLMLVGVLYKFAEAMRGRAGWLEMLVPLVAGGVMLSIIAVIAPTAEGYIEELSTEQT